MTRCVQEVRPHHPQAVISRTTITVVVGRPGCMRNRYFRLRVFMRVSMVASVARASQCVRRLTCVVAVALQ